MQPLQLVAVLGFLIYRLVLNGPELPLLYDQRYLRVSKCICFICDGRQSLIDSRSFKVLVLGTLQKIWGDYLWLLNVCL
jgi:hypothetical protein